MAILYRTNGSTEEVSPKNGKDFQLEEMQALVGGYIQIVPVGDELLVCNEEGKLDGLPGNDRATLLYGRYLPGDYLVGNILICAQNEIE